MAFLSKIKAASYTLKDHTAALACAEYLLETEDEDFFEQAADGKVTYENWSKSTHPYALALKAVGLKPDPARFVEDQD